MPFEKSVGAVVFRREKGKILYLILRHPDSASRVGEYWNFPKGRMEKGEKWEDTLRREIEEEVGIRSLKIFPNFYVWNQYFYRARGEEKEKRRKSKTGINIFKIVTYYLAETDTKEIKLSREHIDFKWLPYEKACEILTFKQTKKVLEKADKFLRNIYSQYQTSCATIKP